MAIFLFSDLYPPSVFIISTEMSKVVHPEITVSALTTALWCSAFQPAGLDHCNSIRMMDLGFAVTTADYEDPPGILTKSAVKGAMTLPFSRRSPNWRLGLSRVQLRLLNKLLQGSSGSIHHLIDSLSTLSK